MSSRNRRPLAWFLAAVVVLLADAGACYWSVGQLLASFRRRAESYEAVNALDRVLSALKDAETGQRGFVLTGEEQYLAPYDSARAEIGQRLEEAEGHLTDPAQRARLAALRATTRQKLDELALTVRLRREQGFEAARRVVAENRGKRYMDDARRTVAEMQRVEQASLARRQAEARTSSARAFATLGVVIALNLLLLGLAYRFLRSALRERRRRFNDAARLASIVDSSDDAIVSKDLEGTIKSWNHGAERIFGYCAGEIVGRSILTIVPEDRREEEEGFLRRLRAGERIDHCETVRVTRDGRRIDVALTISPLRDAAGRIVGASKIGSDITSRKAAERQLLESYRRLGEAERRVREVNQNLERLVAERTAALSGANEQLAEANEQLQAFNYSVSHDLRAPLRAMQGFAQALIEDYGPRLDDTGRDYARRVSGAARRMDNLIHDLLEYSRLRRQELPLGPVSVRQALDDALAAAGADAGAAGATIDIAGAVDGGGAGERIGADCVVRANRALLAQVLANLIGNALKFVRPGHAPVVRVWCERRGRNVRINVLDNGIGIAPEHRDRIFRPFERLHGTEAYPGTGIGLAVVRAGAERMGGACGVGPAGSDGGGSVFWVELPEAE